MSALRNRYDALGAFLDAHPTVAEHARGYHVYDELTTITLRDGQDGIAIAQVLASTHDEGDWLPSPIHSRAVLWTATFTWGGLRYAVTVNADVPQAAIAATGRTS